MGCIGRGENPGEVCDIFVFIFDMRLCQNLARVVDGKPVMQFKAGIHIGQQAFQRPGSLFSDPNGLPDRGMCGFVNMRCSADNFLKVVNAPASCWKSD